MAICDNGGEGWDSPPIGPAIPENFGFSVTDVLLLEALIQHFAFRASLPVPRQRLTIWNGETH